MLNSILIANRGEIARRIIRTCRQLGIKTVAVYSEADAQALFVREADAAFAIGAAPSRESYLAGDKILAAAKTAGVQAIHPGYGFLSENAEFAEKVIQAGFIWIGPKPAGIRAMGLKDAAKKLMAKAGVPTTPGYMGDDQTLEKLQFEADKIGYPLLIKAVAGGGGKGMRKVEASENFAQALASCKREALAAFGDEKMLLEIYVSRPRHIEVQIFGDSQGNVVHMFERDCSLQRRHQKLVEEAPAPGLSDDIRAAICAHAVAAARAVNYENAGTVEFIADSSNGLDKNKIWFMEMNTRLQVEHPVTEAITGLDLVEWQIRIASGEALPLAQSQIKMNGHAIEARLYAENPENGFLPSTGELTHLRMPHDNVRIDSAVEQGSEVTTFYDPLIAKLISHNPTRKGAAEKLARACGKIEIWPVKTNAAFLANALSCDDFLSANLDVGLIERDMAALLPAVKPSNKTLQAAGGLKIANYNTLTGLTGFRLNAASKADVRLMSDSILHNIEIELPLSKNATSLFQHDDSIIAFENGKFFSFTEYCISPADDNASADGTVLSPMPGLIISVGVSEGEIVKKGSILLVMEAMKMEITLTAPCDGMVTSLKAVQGARIAESVELLKIKPEA